MAFGIERLHPHCLSRNLSLRDIPSPEGVASPPHPRQVTQRVDVHPLGCVRRGLVKALLLHEHVRSPVPSQAKLARWCHRLGDVRDWSAARRSDEERRTSDTAASHRVKRSR